MKWEVPLQEVAPKHEGRGSTPPNEGWSGAPCGIPSGTFIRRWKSISCGRASACLSSDMFNLGPYENRRPHCSGLLLSVRGNQHPIWPVSQSQDKCCVQNWIKIFSIPVLFCSFSSFGLVSTLLAYNVHIIKRSSTLTLSTLGRKFIVDRLL